MAKTVVVLGMFVLQVLSSLYGQAAAAGSPVKFLPGFQGPLPFQLETGYIAVGDVQFFYYFIKSESNPKSDPLMIWLSGGPGCSSLSGLIYEIGPMAFEPVEYNGSLPTLITRSCSWTKAANMIFLDFPVGTGFSYSKTVMANQSNTMQATHQAYKFVQEWLLEHQEYMSNPFYVGGDSYSGQLVPRITLDISEGNEKGNNPQINLKGYVLGNPVTYLGEGNYQFSFANGHALISDELYESLEKNCKGETYAYKEEDGHINPENIKCVKDVQTFREITNAIDPNNILEPSCPEFQPLQKWLTHRRLLGEKDINLINSNLLSSKKCNKFLLDLSTYWMNDESVREALHITKGTVDEWERCRSNLNFTNGYDNIVPYHANLSIKGYRSLIYSGDHDMIIPFQSTQAWIRSLNYSIVDEWRPWNVEGQVAGYTRTYANKMTFATVKGSGHTAPEYKPCECLAMIGNWLSNSPL